MSANKSSVLHAMTGGLYSAVRTGLVVERHGDKLLVEDSFTQQLRECEQRSALQKEHLVCGDRVSFQLVKASTARGAKYQAVGLVVGRGARHNLLLRPDPMHKAAKKMKVIAANVDQLFIVVAPVPHVPLETIDQLLAAGEVYGMSPILLINKNDLPESAELTRRLHFYHDLLGYPLLNASASSGEGLAEVRRALDEGDVSVFVGQSGVGKSSLINRLLRGDGWGQVDQELLEVGGLTRKGRLGAHTTTNAKLLRVPLRAEDRAHGSEIRDVMEEVREHGASWTHDKEKASGGEALVIDSPGIRELHLWHLNERQLRQAFPEIEAAAQNCRFRNCSHAAEELGCAVQQGLLEGSIVPSRLQSFFSLLREG